MFYEAFDSRKDNDRKWQVDRVYKLEKLKISQN